MFVPQIVRACKYISIVGTAVLFGMWLQSIVIVKLASGILMLIIVLLAIIVVLLTVLDGHYQVPIRDQHDH